MPLFANTPLRSRLGLAALVLLFAFATQGVGAWSRWRLGEQAAAHARPGDIQMLASVGCVYCAQARAWFERHRIPFSECLIESEPACAQAYAALMSPGTPTLMVRGRRLVGFDAQAVADALAPP
jgi:glutaredoxin